MCISVSLSGFVVLGCMFAPKVHIIMFQPQKNVTSHRLNLNRFSVSGAATTYASHGGLHAVTSFLKAQGLESALLFLQHVSTAFQDSRFGATGRPVFHFYLRGCIFLSWAIKVFVDYFIIILDKPLYIRGHRGLNVLLQKVLHSRYRTMALQVWAPHWDVKRE